MRRNCVDLDLFGTNQADARLLVAIDSAQSRTKVAVAQVGVCLGPLLGSVDGAEQVVARDVVVKKPWRRKVEGPTCGAKGSCKGASQCGSKPW